MMITKTVAPPYITAWSAEPYLPTELVLRDGRISYVDETVSDRDEYGILWYRCVSRQGQGKPDFKRVHPQRQREAMRRLLCQVCAGPADQSEDGMLWLLTAVHDDDWTDWPEGCAVVEPPVCWPCARRTIRQCPALRKTSAIVRATEYPVVGVRGALHVPAWPSPLPVKEDYLAFSHPAIGLVRAVGLLRELRGCTIQSADALDQWW